VFLDLQVPYAFKNQTGYEIPPYGVVVITGATVQEGEIVFSIRRPTASDEIDQEPASVLFNGIQPVPNNLDGVGTRTLPVQALIEQPSSDHPSGLAVGLKANSFALAEGGSCFKILAKDLTDPHIQSGHGVYFVEACHGKAQIFVGRTLDTIAGRSGFTVSKGDVELFRIDDTGTLEEVVDSLGAQVIIEAYNISVDPIQNFVWVEVKKTDKNWIAEELCQ
jgi:hypothetical protein